ncbi:hypothetical protein [Anaerofustis stercorihominis]|uniref:hypothetical protein n=1 Tax=Anaerofustis stercorihominis TaxID=214853 RepID=UPI00214AEA81|nr:hypothetical protein [Anaerofustis stercorihominis]MCR2033715.1 hypothetical protein [Anaerofustis stercorihominis]
MALNTLGIKFKYAVEATAGTRPDSGYKEIPEVKSIPSLSPSPETIDVTPLSETEYKTYVDGLKDLGGALELGGNFCKELIEAWELLMKAYEEAKKDNKKVWFTLEHPSLDQSVFFTGNPASLGVPETNVNSAWDAKMYITPTNGPKFYNKVTETPSA